MPALSAAETIDLWERGGSLGPVDRALVLADAGGAPPGVAALPLGERDRYLLELRAALLGPVLAATTPCPECAEPVEFAVDAEALLGRAPAEVAALELDGLRVDWRPPDSADLTAAASAEGPEEAEGVLLARCVSCAEEPLPPAVRSAVAAAMADADPLAEVLVDLICPACEAAFVADLEVAAFVWTELQARAQRLLCDVDVLAREYGWAEGEVLALSDARRAFYLGLARGGVR